MWPIRLAAKHTRNDHGSARSAAGPRSLEHRTTAGRCRELRAEQWTQPCDLGHQTLAATFQHIIGNVRVWTDLMAERPIQPAADEALTTADLLLAAWQRVYTRRRTSHERCR